MKLSNITFKIITILMPQKSLSGNLIILHSLCCFVLNFFYVPVTCFSLIFFEFSFDDTECDIDIDMIWFIVSYDSANKQKHHKSHRMQ